MYQIAVCDDEKSDLQHNIRLTERVMAQAGIPCSIAAYESGQSLLSDVQSGRHFDLLLLDVIMEKLDGMALAAALKQRPDAPDVVFISTDRDMAMQGYRVEARRYLPKPLEPELLREALLHCYGEARRADQGPGPTDAPYRLGPHPHIPSRHPLCGDLGPGNTHFPPLRTAGAADAPVGAGVPASGVVRVLPPDGFGQSGLCQRHLSRNAGAPGGGTLPVSRQRMAEVEQKLLELLRH